MPLLSPWYLEAITIAVIILQSETGVYCVFLHSSFPHSIRQGFGGRTFQAPRAKVAKEQNNHIQCNTNLRARVSSLFLTSGGLAGGKRGSEETEIFGD